MGFEGVAVLWFFLRECDLNEESHCFRHSLEMRFVLVDSKSQPIYISPILEVYKFPVFFACT